MRAAVVQLNSGADVAANQEAAERHVAAAAADGAELVALPEKWSCLGDARALEAAAEPLDGPVVGAACEWAVRLGIHLLAGSVPERLGAERRLANTSVLISPEGHIVAAYRKIHMFDVDVGGVSYRESDAEEPGDGAVLAPAGELTLGLTVCFDLRFPELYRELALAGATAFTVPSAFTDVTGRAHWESLVRARAIENQAFVLAPDQHGEAPPHYRSHGNSMICDPWGTVLARVADGEGHAVCDLDLEAQRRIRSELPVFEARRPEAYRVREQVPGGGRP